MQVMRGNAPRLPFPEPQRIEITRGPATSYANAHEFSLEVGRSAYIQVQTVGSLRCKRHYARRACGRQAEIAPLSRSVVKHHATFPALLRQDERAHAFVFGVRCRNYVPLRPVKIAIRVYRQSFLIGNAIGNLLFEPFHPRPALGIEFHEQAVVLRGIRTQRSRFLARHGYVGVVFLFFHKGGRIRAQRVFCLINGYETRKAVIAVPVEHGAGKGPYLVKAASQQPVKRQVSGYLSFGNLIVFPNYEIAVVVEQLHVKHLAQIGEPEGRGTHHVCLEINLFGKKVSVVVKVQIHLLLAAFAVVFRYVLKKRQYLFAAAAGILCKARH